MRVEAEGSKNAKYIIVGEAPGKNEVKTGRPFVGASGKLLDRLMVRAGIPRSDCYITNTVKEYPQPSGKIDSFISVKIEKCERSSKTSWFGKFATLEYLEYETELVTEINNCTGNIIIAVGATALFALTRLGNITLRRGSIYEDERFPGKKIIPIIHPSAALRVYDYEYFIYFDLARVKREASYPELKLPNRNLRIEPTFEEAMYYLETCMEHNIIGFDIETKRTKANGKFIDWEISCLGFATGENDAMCIPLLDKKGDNYFDPDREFELWKKVKEVLEHKKVTKLAQNMMFDASFIYKKHNIIINNMEDTMVAQGVLIPDFPKSLAFLVSMYTREPYYKDEGKMHLNFGGDVEKFWRYNAKDACTILEIFKVQVENLKALGNYETYKKQVALLPALLFMQAKGIKMDTDAMKQESIAVLQEVEEKKLELNRLCGREINHNSPKQLMQYFYVEKKIKPFRKGGKLTTNVDALKRLAREHKEAGLILELRGLTKMRSTYLEMAFDEDNRLRCKWNPVGTVSGRLSSGKTIFGTGGNLQNIPKIFRKNMLADPGYIMYEPDLSQAENRIIANIAPELQLLEAFENGVNVHALTASLLSGIAIEEINSDGPLSPLGTGEKTWYHWGKQANFQLNYGIGVRQFALKQEITEKDARWIMEHYFSYYPGIKHYQSWVREQLRKDRTLTNCFGRKRKFFGRWDDALFRSAYDFLAQSTVADIINRRGLAPIYENQETYKPVVLLSQVHDSIPFEMSYEEYSFEEHAKCLIAMTKNIEQPIHWHATTFVIPFETKMGFNLKDMISVVINVDSVEETAKNLEIGFAALLAQGKKK